MENIKIMPMTIEHLEGVMHIEKLSFPHPWSEKALIKEIESNQLARYMVITQGDKVIAFGGMWLIMDEAHITNIAVHPQHRGQGIGNLLMDALIRVAQREGIFQLTLEVRATNDPAIKLYQKYGFEVVGRRKGYYEDDGEDALVMWKKGI